MSNKTKPIGVRFDSELYEKAKVNHQVQTYHQWLLFLENLYKQSIKNPIPELKETVKIQPIVNHNDIPPALMYGERGLDFSIRKREWEVKNK